MNGNAHTRPGAVKPRAELTLDHQFAVLRRQRRKHCIAWMLGVGDARDAATLNGLFNAVEPSKVKHGWRWCLGNRRRRVLCSRRRRASRGLGLSFKHRARGAAGQCKHGGHNENDWQTLAKSALSHQQNQRHGGVGANHFAIVRGHRNAFMSWVLSAVDPQRCCWRVRICSFCHPWFSTRS